MTQQKTQYSLEHLKSEEGKPDLAKLLDNPDAPCLIYSGQWKAHWRTKGSGYVEEIKDAGIYTFFEAWSTVKTCGPEKKIYLELVTEPPLLEGLSSQPWWLHYECCDAHEGMCSHSDYITGIYKDRGDENRFYDCHLVHAELATDADLHLMCFAPELLKYVSEKAEQGDIEALMLTRQLERNINRELTPAEQQEDDEYWHKKGLELEAMNEAVDISPCIGCGKTALEEDGVLKNQCQECGLYTLDNLQGAV